LLQRALLRAVVRLGVEVKVYALRGDIPINYVDRIRVDGLAASRHGDLPVPLTPLIGREREVESLLALLAEPLTRLLTLTGTAGAGKTRLALHLAAKLRDDEHTEVMWVGLIPVQEPERVLAAVAQAVGVRDEGLVPLRDALVDALRGRRCLLLLDNFEQVLPAARMLLEVLMACEGVRALVTSRAPLNVRGERCFPVAPLALPDAAQLASLDELRRVPSVALFVERVTASQPAFTLDGPETGRLVADICTHLDGLPLAIELAAARIRHLGLHQLHERITQPALLSMLTQGPQDLAEHQRTMRSTIAWSYGLLGATERLLFRWLSIFVGGATFEALQAITDLSEEQVSVALTALTDANLVRYLDDGMAPRYTQLVTLRAYAQEQLSELGEWEEARRRHAAYFADFVMVLAQNAGTRPEIVLARVDADYENVRAALAWAYATNATAVGIRMVGALRRFWGAQSQFVEGLEWLERFLARAEAPTTNDERAVLADAWTGMLVLCHRQDRFERAREAGETALALRREIWGSAADCRRDDEPCQSHHAAA
jgi:predicted ATPase